LRPVGVIVVDDEEKLAEDLEKEKLAEDLEKEPASRGVQEANPEQKYTIDQGAIRHRGLSLMQTIKAQHLSKDDFVALRRKVRKFRFNCIFSTLVFVLAFLLSLGFVLAVMEAGKNYPPRSWQVGEEIGGKYEGLSDGKSKKAKAKEAKAKAKEEKAKAKEEKAKAKEEKAKEKEEKAKEKAEKEEKAKECKKHIL
jgi:hypothetical protein